MKKLTEKQKKIIDFIRTFITQNKMAPTVYEIAENFKIKSSTVFAHLKALQKKNYLERSSKARSIILKKNVRKRTGTHIQTIPLQEKNDSSTRKSIYYGSDLFLNKENFSNNRSCYAMILKENCYLSRGILPGDIAILVTDPKNIHPGDLIIAKINDHQELLECKKLFENSAEFFSFLENKTFHFPQDSIPIKGMVIGIQRAL